MKLNNKKGFTLVELLAVIVILAVVMLIAVTAVGPMMTKSRKSALGVEGVGAVDAAKAAFQAEQLNSESGITPTSTVCFPIKYLCDEGYFEKGCTGSGDGYDGSVLVQHGEGGKFTYRFSITNGSYYFVDENVNDYNPDSAGEVEESVGCGVYSVPEGVYILEVGD